MLAWLLCALANTTYILRNCLCYVAQEVPVKFSQSSYTVAENEGSVTITLETPAYHARGFTVYVFAHDGTASGECLQ